MERKSIPIEPFPEYVLNRLSSPESVEKAIPIGIIVFGRNEQALFVGTDDANQVKCAYSNISTSDRLINISGSEGRVFRLPQYDEIITAQIPITEVGIDIYKSITTGDTVNVRFPYYPTDAKGETKIAHIDETELTDLLIGKKGGLVFFKGANLPEEAALVLEKKVDDKNIGIVFFFHPNDSSGLDSDNGLTVFFRSLNEKFDQTIQDKKDRKLLFNFDQAEKPDATYGSVAIARAMLIARILHEKRNQDGHLSEFLEDYFHRKFVIGHRIVETQEAIKEIILTNNKPMGSLAFEETTEERTMAALKTERGKNLRHSYAPHFGKNRATLQIYLNNILDWLNPTIDIPSERLDNINDAIVLLNELRESRIRRNYYNYQIHGNRITFYSSDEAISYESIECDSLGYIAKTLLKKVQKEQFRIQAKVGAEGFEPPTSAM